MVRPAANIEGLMGPSDRTNGPSTLLPFSRARSSDACADAWGHTHDAGGAVSWSACAAVGYTGVARGDLRKPQVLRKAQVVISAEGVGSVTVRRGRFARRRRCRTCRRSPYLHRRRVHQRRPRSRRFRWIRPRRRVRLALRRLSSCRWFPWVLSLGRRSRRRVHPRRHRLRLRGLRCRPRRLGNQSSSVALHHRQAPQPALQLRCRLYPLCPRRARTH